MRIRCTPIVLTETIHVCRGDSALGSCVAVSAALLPQQLTELKEQQQQQQQPALGSTPLLITHGSSDLELPRARVEATVASAKELGIQLISASVNSWHKLALYHDLHVKSAVITLWHSHHWTILQVVWYVSIPSQARRTAWLAAQQR